MNTEHYKGLLLQRQDELQSDVKRYDAAVLDAPVADVGDQVDMAVTDVAKSAAADMSATATGELELVRQALQRIENGTYGECVSCGEQISPARLDAVPWTPYCIKDQSAREAGIAAPATL